jgi:hypothetical protein
MADGFSPSAAVRLLHAKHPLAHALNPMRAAPDLSRLAVIAGLLLVVMTLAVLYRKCQPISAPMLYLAGCRPV